MGLCQGKHRCTSPTSCWDDSLDVACTRCNSFTTTSSCASTGPNEEMPVLNCDVMPVVERHGSTVADGQLGYADALRALIPQVVTSTREATGIGLRIEFGEGAVVIHPAPEAMPGPEIALLDGFADGRWMCWRPGEESFEALSQQSAPLPP